MEPITNSILGASVGAVLGAILIYIADVKKKKDDEKIQNFLVLFTYRDINHFEFVIALNQVPFLHSKNKKVIKIWSKLMKSYDENNYSGEKKQEEQFSDIIKNKKELLMSLSVILNYKAIDWNLIENSYVPRWLMDSQKREQNTNYLLEIRRQNESRNVDIIEKKKGSIKSRWKR